MRYLKVNANKKHNDVSRAIVNEILYPSNKWGFCILDKAKNGEVRATDHSFVYCREFLIDKYRGLVMSKARKPVLDFSKSRLLFLFKHKGPRSLKIQTPKLEKNLKRGVKAVNIIEKKLGWSLTKVYKATLPEDWKEALFIGYVIIGPAKWTYAPALVSLYTLILRSGGHTFWDKFRFFTPKNLESCVDHFRKTRSGTPKVAVGCGNSDYGHIADTRKLWIPLLKNSDEIFFERTQKENYKGVKGYQGIKQLSVGMGQTETISRVRKFVELPIKFKGSHS